MEVLSLILDKLKVYLALPLEAWWRKHQFYANELLVFQGEIDILQDIIKNKDISSATLPTWLTEELVNYIITDVGNKAADIMLNDWYDVELTYIKFMSQCVEEGDFVPTRQLFGLCKAANEIIGSFLTSMYWDIQKAHS